MGYLSFEPSAFDVILDAMELTTCLSRKPTALLIGKVLSLQVKSSLRRAARALGSRRPRPVAPEGLRGPDSALARKAETLVRELSPPYLLHHCFRTYAFAKAIAAHGGLKPDPELLYLACMLHDLGLTRHYQGDLPFELRGAQAARAWCLEHELPARRADLIHEAIALHTSFEAARREPEIALVHIGAGTDVIGYHFEDIAPETVRWIVAQWPRLSFKRELSSELSRELGSGIESPLAQQWRLGFGKMIAQAPFSE